MWDEIAYPFPNPNGATVEIWKLINNFTPHFTWLVVTYPCWDLTHWGRVTHICVSKLTIIGSDNGLSPDRRQAIIWTNAGILLIGTLGTNFNEILVEIHTFSFKNIYLKMSSGKWRPFCLGLNVLSWSMLVKWGTGRREPWTSAVMLLTLLTTEYSFRSRARKLFVKWAVGSKSLVPAAKCRIDTPLEPVYIVD